MGVPRRSVGLAGVYHRPAAVRGVIWMAMRLPKRETMAGVRGVRAPPTRPRTIGRRLGSIGHCPDGHRLGGAASLRLYRSWYFRGERAWHISIGDLGGQHLACLS